jgi:hypothetical protein
MKAERIEAGEPSAWRPTRIFMDCGFALKAAAAGR